MKTIIDKLSIIERDLLLKEIEKKFFNSNKSIEQADIKEIEAISHNLLITNEENVAFSTHRRVINILVSNFIESKFPNNKILLNKIFEFDYEENLALFASKHIEILPNVIEELHVLFLNSEFYIKENILSRKKSKHYLREKGAVYTLRSITREIVKNAIEKSNGSKKANEPIRCLDFACGTGRFYFEALDVLNSNYSIGLEDAICNNLFAIDLDNIALTILKTKVISKFDKLNDSIISAIENNIINRNALIPKTTLLDDEELNIDFSVDFKKVFDKGGFNVVFSNPPFFILKANNKNESEEKDSYVNQLQAKISREIKYFKESGVYQYSIEGMLNYYQLSIEMIHRMTKKDGEIGIICPSSIFADLTAGKLRKFLLTSNKLYSIRYYPESAKLFENVSQSTVIFYLKKGGASSKIDVEIDESRFEVDFDTIKHIFSQNLEIPLISKIEWSILQKISKYNKLKEIEFIRNRRGELDLTLHKKFISNSNTGWRLVRGNMIGPNGIIDKNDEFVNIEDFISKKSSEFKNFDLGKKRIVCQQISNVDSNKRLKFVYCDPKDIIGNSCNYITTSRSEQDLTKLYYLLNSSLLNWRFKITSSNNHVNNYELAELPIIDLNRFELPESVNDTVLIEKVICKLYGLSKDETEFIIKYSQKKEK